MSLIYNEENRFERHFNIEGTLNSRRDVEPFDAFSSSFSILNFIRKQRIYRVRKFSASRHFFKTNVTQSVAEFILYSQKTRNCGHFLSNLAN